ncbi:MAG: hypothetical protein JWO38_53 [Gemmataceae bacterium]|nr:hypothetical protein [Gemmataceae bacterium]
MYSFPTRRVRALFVLCLLVGAGCSGERRATVRGTVTYKNQTLKSGMVKFFGANNTTAGCTILSDGTFTCEGVPMGEVKVAIEQIESGLPGGTKDMGKGGLLIPGQQGPKAGGGKATKLDVPEGASTALETRALPAAVKNPETSGLKYTIDASVKNIEIVIP